ncbi:MAG: glycosyltransferase [Halioglobus sp.]
MSVLIDLIESCIWVGTNAQWPSWLTAQWLTAHDARMICKLSKPDDLTSLRTVLPDPARLIAYPDYPGLSQHLKEEEAGLVHNTFLSMFNVRHYLPISPGMSEQPATELPQLVFSPEKHSNHKPALAFVSPLPPTASGIAQYCVEILPALAQHYEVTLVVENPQSLNAELKRNFAVIDHRQMMKHGSRYERIIYHFGNSPFHYDYFQLLKAHPGVVVLHDIYLGDCILSNRSQLGTSELYQAIYASHGWAAIADCAGPVTQAIGLYPACAGVFNHSYGVIVHNNFASEILSHYFGKATLSGLRQTPLARASKVLPDKSEARQNLGISSQHWVYASFGLINQNKCMEELMDAWEQSGLAQDSNAKLYLVGGCSNQDIEKSVRSWIARLANSGQVVLTGYVDNATYNQYLSATDVAIQLRRNSRGESSAALLDCLGAGLPTIVNAHGSMAELPEDTVIRLDDDFSREELSQTLSAFYSSRQSLEAVRAKGLSHVLKYHSTEIAAAAYTDAIESSYANNPKVAIHQLHSQVIASKANKLPANSVWTLCEEINDLMSCAGIAEPLLAGPQLLVDISAVVRHDLGSGIQRVVRNILRELVMNAYLGYRVEAVYYDFESECFRYARTFLNQFMGLAPLSLCDDTVEARPGDIFLGLDLYYVIAERAISRKWLQYWRGRGVRICHVVYDLLPITLPGFFPPDQVPLFTNWLKAVSQVSDSVICISQAIAHEYESWLVHQAISESSRPNIGYFHLGAEMESRGGDAKLSQSETETLNALREQPYLLMVGTIEPRKGHEQVLDAFQELWSQGCELSLVVVGSMGWIEDRFAARIKQINQENDNFYWLDYVSDDMLKLLYQQAGGTMMASFGEGFGLPLIEAAYYGSPLLARDLPVFREVCGNCAWYFSSSDSTQLASELREWLESYHSNTLPDSADMKWMNWKQSAEELIRTVLQQHRLTSL